MTDWRQLGGRALEWHYNPRVTVGDPQPYFHRYQVLSEATRQALPVYQDLRYGRGERATVDLFPAADGAPLHVFFHGGYWRSQDKRDYAFVARTLVDAGIAVAVANYDLCPDTSVAAINEQAAECVRFLAAAAPEYGYASDGITVSGHSAGGQIVARLMARRWPDEGLNRMLAGGVAISGIFDLEPLLQTSINEPLGLDAAGARAVSPIGERAPEAPLWLLVGGEEPGEFHRQARQYAEYCRRSGTALALEAVPRTNHFSVLTALFAGDTQRLRHLIRFCRDPGASVPTERQ